MPLTCHQSLALQPTHATAAAAVPGIRRCCYAKSRTVHTDHLESTAVDVLLIHELPIGASQNWTALQNSTVSSIATTVDHGPRSKRSSQRDTIPLQPTEPEAAAVDPQYVDGNTMLTGSSDVLSELANLQAEPYSGPPATPSPTTSSSYDEGGVNGSGSWWSPADHRFVLAQQLQQMVLPAGQFDDSAASVLQQAALIAAAESTAVTPRTTKQAAAVAPTLSVVGQLSGDDSSSSSSSVACLVISEQHLLLALLQYSPASLQLVLDSTAAVPAAMAAAQATIQQRVAAAVAAAANYVEYGTLNHPQPTTPTAAAAIPGKQGSTEQQQQASGAPQHQQHQSALQLSSCLLHGLLLARNAGRQAGVAAGVLHLLHGLSSLPDATAVFTEALGAAVVVADLQQQLEEELCRQHSSSGSRNGSAGQGHSDNSSSSGVSCDNQHQERRPKTGTHIQPSTSWQSSSKLLGNAADSSSPGRYSRMAAAEHKCNVQLPVFSSSSGGGSSDSSSPWAHHSSLLVSLTWIDSTLASILTAAEHKDPAAVVGTLTTTMCTLSVQQQQQHRPDEVWLSAAWDLIAVRLNAYLSLSCYLNSSKGDLKTVASARIVDSVTDSVEASIQGAAHTEAAALLGGVAAAAAVCLHEWDCKVPGMCTAVDQVMSNVSQFDGSNRWQLGDYNISGMYLPVMLQVLPVAHQLSYSTVAVGASNALAGQHYQQQLTAHSQLHDSDSTAVCVDVYNNFVRLFNHVAARQQQGLLSSLLSSWCSPQVLAEALLTVINMEQDRAGSLSSSGSSQPGTSSSGSTGTGTEKLLPSVFVGFCSTLATALRADSSSSSKQVQMSGSACGSSVSHGNAGSSSTTHHQQQALKPETVVAVMQACQSLPAGLAANTSIITAATELTAAAWMSVAAATDDYTSSQLVRMLVTVRQNNPFLRYAAAVAAAVGVPSRAVSISSSSSSSADGSGSRGASSSSSSSSRDMEMKMLVAATKQILQRLCTKRTLDPSEAAAALAVLETPLWPSRSSSEISQSPLVQGLLSRVTESIPHMTAQQLEQLLSVAIRLPWGEVGFKLSEEWMRRVLTAVFRVTADVAVTNLDVATASTLAAALGDLCNLPVAATQQQMNDLQQALPLLLPRLDQRHTAMVLSFVSRQAQRSSQAACVMY